MSSTLYDEIQALRATYPRSRSAVLPALRLAQERHGGWLPEEAFREVADALDTTPAFCLSIATFYDMFHTEPVGRRLVEVCTNVSCALSGAQDVVDAFERELGIHVGETEDGCGGKHTGSAPELTNRVDCHQHGLKEKRHLKRGNELQWIPLREFWHSR